MGSLVDLVRLTSDAVDDMMRQAKDAEMPDADSRILTASFVDVDNIIQTTRLGRTLGEMCANRLTQHKYTVVDMRARQNSVVIRPDGQFLLSRDTRELAGTYKAQYVLVGTYTRTRIGQHWRALKVSLREADPQFDDQYTRDRFVYTPDLLYISLRLIKSDNNTIVASHNVSVLCDDGIQSMLNSIEDIE